MTKQQTTIAEYDSPWKEALEKYFPAFMAFFFPKLLDYRDRWSELESSRNAFAVVVMAHLKATETAKDRQSRFQWKVKLVRHLDDLNYERQDILELFRFIDWNTESTGKSGRDVLARDQ